MTPYRTARERAAHASAQTAIARALAHTKPPEPDDQDDDHGYISPARARQIRHEIEQDQRHAH